MSCKTYTPEELTEIIEHAALDLMTEPITDGKKADGTMMSLQEIANKNSLFSLYNSGIRTLARMLVKQLTGEEDQE